MAVQENPNVFIDNAFVASKSSKRIDMINPANEEVFARVADADAGDVDAAVTSSKKALAEWRRTSVQERCGVLMKIADGFAARADEMDTLLTQENGATKAWAGYVGSGGQWLYRMAAGAAAGFQLEEVRETTAGKSLWINDPIGVVAAIVPWNSPQVLIGSKIGPALVAGCTVVLKPSPETTLDSIMLAEIIRDAGVPAGVVNVVPGGRETGAALVAHDDVDMVSFTGSSAAGRAIASVCGQQLKRVSAELGGKSAALVLEDADIEAFKASIHAEVVPYSGQVCYSNTRVLVHRSRFDEVLNTLVASMSAPVGDPTDPSTVFGPLITAAARDKSEHYIRMGVEEGARIVLGGGRPKGLDKGFYIEPTIFVDVKPEMKIFQDEIFGPVLCVVPFDNDDEAVALSNDSHYGLAGAVFGQDLDHANAVARRLETGRVIVNNAKGANRFSSLWKTSGLGTVGEMGPYNFLQPRNITQPV